MPKFSKKKNLISSAAVLRDRKYPATVHIIGLAKTKEILKDPLTPWESTLATQIIIP